MPIYDFGYRGYEGPIGSRWWRWTVITRQGVRLALRKRLLRRLLFLAWTPMLYFAMVFFAIGTMTESDATPPAGLEQEMDSPEFWDDLWKAQVSRMPHGQHEQRRESMAMVRHTMQAEAIRKVGPLYRMVEGVVGPRIALRMVYDAPSVRTAAWTACFYYYFTRVQGLLMMLVVTIVAPALIANDLRGRSFLIYFSSAITKSDYILGKLAVVVLLIAAATLLPGIALYIVSIAFAPSIGALADTYHIVFGMIALLLIVGVPAGLASLYLSSVTTHPRFAAFSWIAFWVMGLVFYLAIVGMPGTRGTVSNWAFLVSPYHVMMVLTEWVFNVRGQLDAIGAENVLTDRLPQAGAGLWAAAFVAAISVLSIVGLWRRTSATVNV